MSEEPQGDERSAGVARPANLRERNSSKQTQGHAQSQPSRHQRASSPAADKQGVAYDILVRDTVFPEPASVFLFRLKGLTEIRDTACVVLDTNALLVPYSTGREGLQEIAGVLRHL